MLACRSYKFSRLDFDELLVPFQCKDVQPGYIFQENKSLDSAKVAEMQTATFYYAQGNHPCADMFFKDDAGALYLVDVGGTSEMSKAQKKIRKMDEVLMNESLRDDLQVAGVKGVVLLPNIESIKASATISDIANRLKPKAGEPNSYCKRKPCSRCRDANQGFGDRKAQRQQT